MIRNALMAAAATIAFAAPAAAPCGELKAQIAKQPICQARTLEGKTGDPTGPGRAVERSIYRTLAPLAPGTH